MIQASNSSPRQALDLPLPIRSKPAPAAPAPASTASSAFTPRTANSLPPVVKGPVSFQPPAHQALDYVQVLSQREEGLRDLHDLGSPQWLEHQKNVDYFNSYPKYLKQFPAFDVDRERQAVKDDRIAVQAHNKTVRKEREGVKAERDAELSNLAKLLETQWAIENEGKRRGHSVFGKVKTVPPLDAEDQGSWYRSAPQPLNVEGITEAGIARDIASSKAKLDRLDDRIERLNRSERTTRPYPQLEFMTRDEILDRAFPPKVTTR